MNLVVQTVLWVARLEPTDGPEWDGEADLVTPGVVGFVVTFLIAAITLLLILDMTRRIRRLRYREEIKAKIAAEQADAAAASATGPDDASTSPRAPEGS
jgi:hypothetical protein